MTDHEMLLQMFEMMKGMSTRLDSIESRLDKMQENLEETRTSVQALEDWAGQVVAITNGRIPIKKAE